MVWTICFLVRGNKVCLAMKKRGHGVGKWNGTGGKPLEGESLDAAAKRETLEEIGVSLINLTKVAEIEFKDLPSGSSHFASVYISTEWVGEPVEMEEMRPEWFKSSSLPFDHMWSADRVWIPEVLAGRRIKAVFEYSAGDTLQNSEITVLEGM